MLISQAPKDNEIYVILENKEIYKFVFENDMPTLFGELESNRTKVMVCDGISPRRELPDEFKAGKVMQWVMD